MKAIIKTLINTAIVLCFASNLGAQDGLKLTYNKAAANWNEALPIGNGRLAAMIYGGAAQERLQLNEETLWKGSPHNNIAGNEKNTIDTLRKLLFSGQYAAAQSLSKEKIKSPQNGMSYQPAGDLLLRFGHSLQVSDYTRTLDISNATHTVSYLADGIRFKRTSFASLSDHVIVVHCTANKKGAINFELFANSPHASVKRTPSLADNSLSLTAHIEGAEGIPGKISYESIFKVIPDGGTLLETDSSLLLKGANAATIYITINSNFTDYKTLATDFQQEARNIILKASAKTYTQLLNAHTRTYKNYYNRVSLDLGKSDNTALPTHERVAQSGQKFDPELLSLYFQFGRYLLISSSMPGNQPANLQGKWNDKTKPAWDSKYTININTQMNYWPSEVTNLPETAAPLFQMLKELSVTGQQSAKEMYGARGWVAHHNTDIWRITGIVDGGWYGVWPMGGAWLCRHLWEHYLYTGDKKFLEEYYPVMKGAAMFYVDALQAEPEHGWLVVAPSMSPENSYGNGPSGKDKIALTYGTTMDNQIVNELFGNVIAAAGCLKKISLLSIR